MQCENCPHLICVFEEVHRGIMDGEPAEYECEFGFDECDEEMIEEAEMRHKRRFRFYYEEDPDRAWKEAHGE